VAGSTAGNALACVRECDEPVRAEWKVSVQKRWPFLQRERAVVT